MKIASTLAEKAGISLEQAQTWIRETLVLASRIYNCQQAPIAASVIVDKKGVGLAIQTAERKFRRYL